MSGRRTLDVKRRKQRAMDRRRADIQAEHDREAHEAKVQSEWMRFVAIRFPQHYRPERGPATEHR